MTATREDRSVTDVEKVRPGLSTPMLHEHHYGYHKDSQG